MCFKKVCLWWFCLEELKKFNVAKSIFLWRHLFSFEVFVWCLEKFQQEVITKILPWFFLITIFFLHINVFFPSSGIYFVISSEIIQINFSSQMANLMFQHHLLVNPSFFCVCEKSPSEYTKPLWVPGSALFTLPTCLSV